MLVRIISFGSNWWARFGRDRLDPYRFTRHAAYFNSTGIRCGHKMRRHWVVPGLIRFNGSGGGLNPLFFHRAIGKTFNCPAVNTYCGGNRVLLERKAGQGEPPDRYLVVFASEIHGRINFDSDDWVSPDTVTIAASQLRESQETMFLMKPGEWVRTDCGLWW